MTKTNTLLEPSFVDAISAIEEAADLSKSKKGHWICSLRQIGKWLDRPLQLIPARWTSIRLPAGQLHHARLDVTAKTLANHRANVAAALRWYGKEYAVPARGALLSAEWAVLRDAIGDRGRRARLYGLIRYCSGQSLSPASVDDGILIGYLHYRGATSALAADNVARRSIARAWNACANEIAIWPAQRLIEPPVKAGAGPCWEDFPEGLSRHRCLPRPAG